ncbi:MAG: hypothetical protein U0R52_03165 [Solirubrobacterales bacterium]
MAVKGKGGRFLSPALGLAEDDSGNILAVGGTSGHLLAVARFLPSGTPDPGFADDGLFEGGPKPPRGPGIAITTQANGRILASGVKLVNESTYRGTCITLARFMPSGILDPGFGTARPGWSSTCMFVDHNLVAGMEGRSVLVGSDGKIVVGGAARWGQPRSTAIIARYLPNGKLDRTYKGDARTHSPRRGIIEFGAKGDNYSWIWELKRVGGGKILASGANDGRFMVARVNEDGTLDPSFGHNGMTLLDLDGSKKCECSYGAGMAVDHKRRILVVGRTEKEFALARFHRDGSVDRSFGHNGAAKTKLEGPLQVLRVAVQHDGKIVAVGISEGQSFTVVRYRANGELDRSFFGDGVYTTRFFGGQSSSAWDVLIDHEGRIVVGGGGPDFGEFVLMRFLP